MKGLGVWLGPLLAATRAASRSPRLEYARPRASNSADVAIGHRRPAPAGISNRAPMPPSSPPAPRHPRWGSGCGCSLYPPPPRSPRLEHAPPRLLQRRRGHRRHAPAGITTRAPQPYARAAAACAVSARGVWAPASYLTGVGSGRLRVSCLRPGGQAGERGRRAG
eukprot:scaffold18539_cov99-Isochrysis_galbana.AAC.1